MIESRKPTRVRRLNAEAVAAGHHIIGPAGTEAAEVVETVIETDDYGTPAVVVATLDSGQTLRIATGSQVQVAVDEREVAAGSIPAQDGTPEAVIAHVVSVHPESEHLQGIAERLTRGMNFKSGSNLQDVHDLALSLLVDFADAANARRVCDLLTELPFDGNFGRWKWIEGALALASYLAFDDGDADRADAYSASLRTADDAETDPLKAKLAAAVRQRQLNAPNLYDPEINRAAAAGDTKAEKDWRVVRLTVLLYLRSHGGSETLTADELARRIHNELVAIRAL
ncbi:MULTISPECIES: DUF6707 family protein [unclassified Arthrobacter]|uniref:DUF6707 family protein n=1 Tax=unclassified Arthrobacter TaxID=235627 RepID=UPI0014919304|nr:MULTISPECIES: DUF6707 family protein [unclassified Arthrobacter]MBE0008208.1 hypothetical protein [Arthrobacter sp. AET 35A]NOJ61947.1 hypothetical protein [Arthrobacter sp. 147(2020)]